MIGLATRERYRGRGRELQSKRVKDTEKEKAGGAV